MLEALFAESLDEQENARARAAAYEAALNRTLTERRAAWLVEAEPYAAPPGTLARLEWALSLSRARAARARRDAFARANRGEFEPAWAQRCAALLELEALSLIHI